MTTVQQQVGAARSRLAEAGVPPADAAWDAEALARHVLGWDRATYLSQGRHQTAAGFDDRYRIALDRRARREPVSLITGRREFWGLPFEVTPAVLTPRPETELLVEEAVTRVRDSGWAYPHLVDVGTGSGCVAIALARELPTARLTGTDVSSAALAVARRNASRLGVAKRIRWISAPLLRDLDERPDLITANLPYVPSGEIQNLPPEVKEFEPHLALNGGPDGLELVRRLIDQSRRRLRPGGFLVLEVGAGQTGSVVHYVRGFGEWSPVGVRDDLQGIPRVVVLQHRETRG